MAKKNERIIIEITAQQIYDSIEELKALQRRQHSEVIGRLDETNGRVKLNRWVASTAMTLIMGLILFLAQSNFG